MGKGFDTFMANPYWKRIYEEAPSEALKEYLRQSFEYSATCKEDSDAVPLKLTKQDYQYLYDHAEGCYYRSILRKMIAKFDEE